MYAITNFLLIYWMSAFLMAIPDSPYFMTEEFYEMPKLYRIDDYGKCMERKDALFCSLQIHVYKGDKPNEVWDMIQEYSNNTMKYHRHDILNRGVCMSERYNLTSDKYLQIMQGDKRSVLQTALDSYMKEELTMKYNLMGNISIELCGHHKESVGMSVTRWLYAAIVILLISLSICGSFIHEKDHNKDFIHRVVAAFSFTRNLDTFLRQCETFNRTTSSASGTYHRGLQGIRAIIMMLVILSHAIFLTSSWTENTVTMEWIFGHESSKILFNTTVLMQILFCVSGYLLSYSFFETTSRQGDISLRHYPTHIIRRWLRFAPVYLFTLGYVVLWSDMVNANPPITSIPMRHVRACQTTWWINLLYINNMKYEWFKCMPQTWFLAAEMQLHTVMVAVLLLLWKTKPLLKYVLSGSLLLAVCHMTYTIYINNYPPIILATPQAVRDMFEYSASFSNVYIQTYSNSVSYIVGVIAGYTIFRIEQKEITLTNLKLIEKASKSILPVLGCVMSSGAFIAKFYVDANYDYQGGMLPAVYAPLNKMVVAGAFCVYLIAMACNTKYYLKHILESKAMVLLGSLTYPALMIHWEVQNYLVSSDKLFRISFYTLTKLYVLSVAISYALALAVHVVIEMPVRNLHSMAVTKSLPTEKRREKKRS